MNLAEKIHRIRELAREKDYNDEFILSAADYEDTVFDPVAKRNYPSGLGPVQHWSAGVSNPTNCVMLGEAVPEIYFDSDTIEGAVDGLLAKMEAL